MEDHEWWQLLHREECIEEFEVLPPKSKDHWYIYELVDPRRDWEVRYIGMTIDPRRRLRQHLLISDGNYHKNHWIVKLLSEGVAPRLNIIASGIGGGWEAKEQYFIRKYRNEGHPLVNITDGGRGGPGPQTPETRAKISAKAKEAHRRAHIMALAEMNRGRRLSPEHRLKIGAAHRGMKRSEETRARLRAAANRPEQKEKARITLAEGRNNYVYTDEHRAKISEIARNRTPETLAKMSATATGRKQSAETVAKRVEKLTGHVTPPEVRAKISQAHKGKIVSDETRKRMSEAKKEYFRKLREEQTNDSK